jgi:hypothetical protein
VASAAILAMVLVSVVTYLQATVVTPRASEDIWHQQAQTARFVHDYWAAPVAVNDLGLVSYRGGQPVLDLWGLASQDARRLRVSQTDHWVGPLVRRSGVQLAAVYPQWFSHQIPAAWVRVGTLVGAPPVASSSREVVFYATRPDAVTDACTSLARFRKDDSDVRIDLAPACLR